MIPMNTVWKVEKEAPDIGFTWRDRLWRRLFHRLPVRSELRCEARSLRLDVQNLHERLIEVNARIEVLECGKHHYKFESYTRDRFDFRCTHCGHQIQKTADELTLEERRALGDLGILPPLPTVEAIRHAMRSMNETIAAQVRNECVVPGALHVMRSAKGRKIIAAGAKKIRRAKR